MSATKHTPGPWRAQTLGNYEVGREDEAQEWMCEWDIYGPNDEEIAIMLSDADDDKLPANARLIAAAPELLARYEWLVDEIVRLRLPIKTVVDRQLIAKAKGDDNG